MVSIAIKLKPGCFSSIRSANRKSCSIAVSLWMSFFFGPFSGSAQGTGVRRGWTTVVYAHLPDDRAFKRPNLTRRSNKKRTITPTIRPSAPATNPRNTIAGPSLIRRDHSATPPTGWVITRARVIKTGTSQYFRTEKKPAVIVAATNHTLRMSEAC